MEITFSRRLFFIILLLLLIATTAALLIPRLTGKSLVQAVGLDTGQSAALAGVQAFYAVDYTTGPDRWAARLCALSTQMVCELYQNTFAPFLWTKFITAKTIVTAEVTNPILVAEPAAGGGSDAPMQIWQVAVTLSAPWPQGDGQTSFPAHVLVVREGEQWKFERFLLKDELARYSGGEQ